MGRINAAIMPVLATLVCILLVAYHLKDPTQDGKVFRTRRVSRSYLELMSLAQLFHEDALLEACKHRGAV